MNYTKLTISITAGILLAAAIIAAVIEIPEYQRQKRIQARFARMEAMAQAQACLSGGCPEGAYARAMKSVGKDPSRIGGAARMFCIETAWTGAAPERKTQLIAECETATIKRMADDLK